MMDIRNMKKKKAIDTKSFELFLAKRLCSIGLDLDCNRAFFGDKSWYDFFEFWDKSNISEQKVI